MQKESSNLCSGKKLIKKIKPTYNLYLSSICSLLNPSIHPLQRQFQFTKQIPKRQQLHPLTLVGIYQYTLSVISQTIHPENLATIKLTVIKRIYRPTRQNPQNLGTRNLYQIITSRDPIKLSNRKTNAVTIPK